MTREERVALIKAAGLLGTAGKWGWQGVKGLGRLGRAALPAGLALGGAYLGAESSDYGKAREGAMQGAVAGGMLGLLGQAGAKRGYSALSQAMSKTSGFDPSLRFSLPIPGIPLQLNLESDKEERLPGMSNWVPRSMLTEAFKQAKPPEELLADAEKDNRGVHALAGAAAASAALDMARRYQVPGVSEHVGTLMSGKGALVRALAALGGAGLGVGYNFMTAPKRREQMQDAIDAAAREREKFPLAKKEDSTASSVAPMLLTSGSGV